MTHSLRTTQSEFINGLLLRCFGRMNTLNTSEGELFDALVECSTHGLLHLNSNLARAVLISACVRRVRELHLVDHPETVVKSAFADMLQLMHRARDGRTADELRVIQSADDFSGEWSALREGDAA